MNKILFYTCHHLSLERDFWNETRRHLERKNVELTIAGSKHAAAVTGQDINLNFWELEHNHTNPHWLHDRLDWHRLETCAKGYGEPYSPNAILDQAVGLIIQLAITAPTLVAIYNNKRREGNLLDQLCRIFCIPCLTIERLPWPGWISADPGGMLSECRYIRNLPLQLQPAPENPLADEFSQIAGKNISTWWAQPNDCGTDLTKVLPKGKKILLFLHQKDADAQNFAYNPHFKDNAEALRWLVKCLPTDGSVFILGKHHPKADAPTALYQNILGTHGYWTDTHSAEECLDKSDAIVAVNSSLLFEAVLTGKAVASLGVTVLHGRSCFVELESINDTAFISRLFTLPRSELDFRRENFRDYTEYILQKSFCMTTTANRGYAERGPAALAKLLANHQCIEKHSEAPPLSLKTTALNILDESLHELESLHRSRLVRIALGLTRFKQALGQKVFPRSAL